ncbi:class I SAM-dependent methyltransferase [Pedobacter aquatilis]|uniref:class I SAM-dependent methyltransferase n=1 Tax=Pedobacter aquatilis TaxID=351343 RepID=UPI002930C5EC|nr:class I SAM-dependent methyltransferase [Pedobacter aquatilis]
MNFSEQVNSYINTEENNNFIFEQFNQKTKEIEWLYNHRLHVEENQLGFGDAAFHYMWYLLLNHLNEPTNSNPINLLEIGVFKGQVISLWALIAKKMGINTSIFAISPFEGKTQPKSKLLYKLLIRFSKKFRRIHESANFYDDVDYFEIVKKHFEYHELEFDKITLHKGYSTENKIINSFTTDYFDIIYIDGDHTYDTVIKDIKNYTPFIKNGGFLIMDDASNNIPGTAFWKGHQQVSDAAEIIPTLGFVNVMNVGHNRIYKKL